MNTNEYKKNSHCLFRALNMCKMVEEDTCVVLFVVAKQGSFVEQIVVWTYLAV